MKRIVKSTLSMAMWLLVSTIICGSAAVFTSCGENTLEEILGTIDNPSGSTTVAVASITLNETSLEKKLGDVAVTLTPTVKPDDATDKTVSWTSSDPNVATVANGKVSVIGEGTAIITATANDGSGVKATCTVTVNIPGVLAGKFTINANGDQVRFSQGNLQAKIAGNISTDPDHYTYTASSWKLAEHQWDYIGNAAGNNSFANNSTVDLFGWVGASASYNSYGLCTRNDASSIWGSDFAKFYGNNDSESLKYDWGTVAITNGGNTPFIFGWRTLSATEWGYLFKTRTASTVGGTDDGRYARAKVNGVAGVILFPDSYTHPDGVTAPASVNTTNASYTANTYDATAWGKMEAAGCVFLPAAGKRNGTNVNTVGNDGYYWSSTPMPNNKTLAGHLLFYSNGMSFPDNNNSARYFGFSVRLVYDPK